jgi:hypothetical protein
VGYNGGVNYDPHAVIFRACVTSVLALLYVAFLRWRNRT